MTEYAKGWGFICNAVKYFLKFRVSKLAFEDEDFSDVPFQAKNGKDLNELQFVYYYPAEVTEELNKITSISVKVLLPSKPSTSVSALGIAALCKDIFPNMRPGNSSLTLYYNNQKFKSDAALLPEVQVPGNLPAVYNEIQEIVQPDYVFKELADCIQRKLDPACSEVQTIIIEHFELAQQNSPMSKRLYIDVTITHITYPKFRQPLDRLNPKLVDYILEAMKVFVNRQ